MACWSVLLSHVAGTFASFMFDACSIFVIHLSKVCLRRIHPVPMSHVTREVSKSASLRPEISEEVISHILVKLSTLKQHMLLDLELFDYRTSKE